MDHDEDRGASFTEPPPAPRFQFSSSGGAVMLFADYDAAVAFYTAVLGEPAYAEGDSTRGWPIGDSWLTLLAGGDGAPRNTEIGLLMATPQEAERLQAAFITAGAEGPDPTDELMYEPIRSCPVTDPFGTRLLVYARR